MNLKIETAASPHVIHQAIEWIGQSGTPYRYYIWPRGAKIPGRPPGNFLHVKVADDGTLVPVQIGQTEDLNRRIVTPEERACIDACGATQLHLRMSYQGEMDRLEEEADLVARWHPICNAQIRHVPIPVDPQEEAMRLGT